MKYKIVKAETYGFNIKTKKNWWSPWRFIMSNVYDFLRLRFNTEQEAQRYIDRKIEDEEFLNKAKYFDPIP